MSGSGSGSSRTARRASHVIGTTRTRVEYSGAPRDVPGRRVVAARPGLRKGPEGAGSRYGPLPQCVVPAQGMRLGARRGKGPEGPEGPPTGESERASGKGRQRERYRESKTIPTSFSPLLPPAHSLLLSLPRPLRPPRPLPVDKLGRRLSAGIAACGNALSRAEPTVRPRGRGQVRPPPGPLPLGRTLGRATWGLPPPVGHQPRHQAEVARAGSRARVRRSSEPLAPWPSATREVRHGSLR